MASLSGACLLIRFWKNNPRLYGSLMFDLHKKEWARLYWLSLSVIVVCAVAFKVVYLTTAESKYNSEELPLAAMALASGSDAITNVGVTRLYGTSYITTALSLEAFGFTTLGVKAPNIVFFFLAIFFIFLFSRDFLKYKKHWLSLVPILLLCVGPPVLQMWGMKNRGGFIENIFALSLCLWLIMSARDSGVDDVKKFLIGLTVGVATWSQPIGLLWGGVVIGYLVLLEFQSSVRSVLKSVSIFILGLFLGLMPLIALNFLFQFNTVNVIGGGELPGGVDLGYWGRFSQLVSDGIPRLLGLKEQWSAAWVVPKPFALLLYGIFLIPVCYATLKVCIDVVFKRKLDLNALLVGIAFIILAANVASSWGNFQAEPRRLLMLYIPFVLLTVSALSGVPRLAVGYLTVWVLFNLWSNYSYVVKHPDGFSHPPYRSLENVAKFLQSKSVSGVYTDIWTGSRVTFESEGRIPWYRTSYMPTSYGFVGDDKLQSDEALLFNFDMSSGISAYQKFTGDAQRAGVTCENEMVDNIRVLYGCASEFYLSDIAFSSPPMNAASERTSGQILLAQSAVSNEVKVIVGKKIGAEIIATGKPGYLIYGPYASAPAGDYSLTLKGGSSSPFVVDVAADQGRQIIARSEFVDSSNFQDGVFAKVDFSLDRAVDDLEIRVLVPSGSNAVISDYKVIVR